LADYSANTVHTYNINNGVWTLASSATNTGMVLPYATYFSARTGSVLISNNGAGSVSRMSTSSKPCPIGSPPTYGTWNIICSNGFIPSGMTCSISCSIGTVIGTAISCLNGQVSGSQSCSTLIPYTLIPTTPIAASHMVLDNQNNILVCHAGSPGKVSKYTSNGIIVNNLFASGVTGCSGISIGPDNKIYISNSGNIIFQYPSTGGSSPTNWSPGSTLSSPRHIIWTSSQTLLVVNSATGNVWQFPLTGGAGSQFCTTSPTAASLFGIAINPTNGDVYMSSKSSPYNIYKVGSAGGTATVFAVTPYSILQGIAFDPTGVYLYATNFATSAYFTVTNVNTVVTTSFTTSLPSSTSIVFTKDGSMLVTSFSGFVTKFPLPQQQVLASNLPSLPYSITQDNNNNYFYICHLTSNIVSKWNSNGILISNTFASGINGCGGLNWGPDGKIFM
jgi:hypothetical protein